MPSLIITYLSIFIHVRCKRQNLEHYYVMKTPESINLTESPKIMNMGIMVDFIPKISMNRKNILINASGHYFLILMYSNA